MPGFLKSYGDTEGPLETIDIHANGKFITEWLE